MTLIEIEKTTKDYAEARKALKELIAGVAAEIAEVKRKAMPIIKARLAKTAERETALRAAIESAPELFEKPRTQVFHDIKVGFRKGTGGLDWDDDERVAALIKKHFPEQYEVLVKTVHKPQSKALQQLDVSDLKKVGCIVEATGDVVVIKATDSEVEKLVNTLLKGAVDEAEKEVA